MPNLPNRSKRVRSPRVNNGYSSPSINEIDSGTTPSVSLLACAADAAMRESFNRSLTAAGIRVTDAIGEDAILVCLTPESIQDADWMRALQPNLDRCVVLAQADLDTNLVPPSLRERNWLVVDREASTEYIGQIILAVLVDTASRYSLRDVEASAASWASDPDGRLLPTSKHELGRVDRVMDEASAAGLTISDTLRNYRMAASRQVRSTARRRYLVQGLGVILALATALTVIVILPRVIEMKRLNVASGVGAGDLSLNSESPRWSMLRALTLLSEGTPAQKAVARPAAFRLAAEPWDLEAPDVGAGNSIEDGQLLGDHQTMLLVVFDGSKEWLVSYDVKLSAYHWRVDLGGDFSCLAISPDSRIAAIAGGDGVAIVDLTQRIVRQRISAPLPGCLQVAWDQSELLFISDGEGVLHKANLLTAQVTKAARDGEETLDLVQSATGEAKALTFVGPDHYMLRNLSGGEILASTTSSPRPLSTRFGFTREDAHPIGAASPDSDLAFIVDEDSRITLFGRARERLHTGLVFHEGDTMMRLLPNGRLVVGGRTTTAIAYDAFTFARLGPVCDSSTRTLNMRPSTNGNYAVCIEETGVVASPIPDLLVSSANAAEQKWASGMSGSSSRARVSYTAGKLTIDRAGEARVTAIPPIASSGTRDASAVLVSSEEMILLGFSDATIVAISPADGARVLWADWRVPTGSAVVALAWGVDGKVLARSADGLVWHVPLCVDCVSDKKLIEAYMRRGPGCFSERQLSPFSRKALKRFGLRQCPDYPWGG